MLKPINPISNQVAEGRRFASRSIVITNLSAIECVVFRREVIPAVASEDRDETVWEGGLLLSDGDEHATKYEKQGYAMMLFDKFSGGSIHSDGDDINSGEAVFYAQIEPFHYEDYESKAQMLRNAPDWKPKKGDIFAMVIDEDLIKWVEVVGVSGQSIHAHHGERYILNVRDSLMHLEPFINQEQVLKPESNIFPIKLDQLMYSDAPFYEVHDNDPSTMSDDEITIKKFKLINFTDPQLQNYAAVISIVHLFNRTNSPYFFNAADQAKITVNVGDDERYILSSDGPVNGIETPLGQISYVLFMIDHVALVRKIKDELTALRPVQIKQGNKLIFEFLPLQYDEVRKAYHFVCTLILSNTVEYQLTFTDGEVHNLVIDATAVQGVI